MLDSSSSFDDSPAFDSDVVQNWVTETAEKKGVTEGELFDEILASYWLLTELSGRISDPESESDTPPKVEATRAKPTDTLETEISDIRRKIDQLSSTVDTYQAQTEGDIEQVYEHLNDLHDRVDAFESELKAGDANTDTEGDACVDPDLERKVDRTRKSQTDLKKQIQDEFDSIETILEYLLETTDDLEAGLEAVRSSRQDGSQPAQQDSSDRDRLVAIKQKAIRLGVDSAVCDHCDQQIDLGLLEVSHCPGCGRTFLDVTTTRRFLFTRATLHTTPTQDTTAKNVETDTNRAPHQSTSESGNEATNWNESSNQSGR